MDEATALARLHDILSRPEYQLEQSLPWWQQLFGPLVERLGYELARFVQVLLDASAGREGWLGLGVVAACLVLVVAVSVYLLRALRLAVTHESRRASTSLVARRERSDRLWQKAHQLAATGELAEAVRCIYLSALYALDERALLHLESSLTNREHVRQLSQRHPDLGQIFADVVLHYDRVRYGRFPVTQTIFAELSRRVDRARHASLQTTAEASVS